MHLEDKIKNYCLETGLDIARITSAEHLYGARDRNTFSSVDDERDYEVNETRFWNPRSVMSDAKSVIVVAESYLTTEPFPKSELGNPLGKIARYTWRNYYLDVKTKLAKVCKFIKKETESATNKNYSCGPIAEKALAERAGVGWYGKNCIIQTEQFGSWVVLGEIVTNIGLNIDEPTTLSCGQCRACIDSCPTGALVAPYTLDRSKCLQHLTNWYGIFPDRIKEIWNDRLYGCTTCQDVCPRNKNAVASERKPQIGVVGPTVPLTSMLKMTKDEFLARFHRNQIGAGWINFRSIQRNAAMAMGNIMDTGSIESLAHAIKNPDPVVRAHVVWALGRFSSGVATKAINNLKSTENNDLVKLEIEKIQG